MMAANLLTKNVFLRRIAAIGLCIGAPAVGQQYALTDLGSLGGPSIGAFGINANHMVVGYSALATADFHGFLWDGTMHDLAPVGDDTQSHALAINSSGQVVSVSYRLGALVAHAVYYEGGATIPFGDFLPRGINNTGTVVGYTSLAVNGSGWVDRACMLNTGLLQVLPTLGGSFSYAYDVNESNQVVGFSYTTGESARHATLWRNGVAIDLGTLGGANSQAYAINQSGQIVGAAENASARVHAFLFQLNGNGQVTSRTDLGELGGGFSYAYDVNNGGEVVGTSDSRALYWKQGIPIDLNKRAGPLANWRLSSAQAIGDNGAIAGMGFYLGWPHAFLLTPVAPDFDGDGDVDQEDFAFLQRCYSGPGKQQVKSDCWPALLDSDDDIDQADLAVFQKCFTGPAIPATANCWR